MPRAACWARPKHRPYSLHVLRYLQHMTRACARLQRALPPALDARLRDAAARLVVRRQQRVRAGHAAQVRDHLPRQRLHLDDIRVKSDLEYPMIPRE